MSDAPNGAEAIRSAGWTQGSVLHATDDETVEGILPGVSYLVLSHPCDVVSSSFERDPLVEITRTSPSPILDGNLTFGKNPRTLQLDR